MMKKRKLIINLIIVVVLILISAATFSEVRSFSTVSSIESGGKYVLTIRSVEEAKPTSYQLLDTFKQANFATGCCCLVCIPIIQK
jgi:ABC-type phosphate/phosphonate transport system permease subunit